MRKFIIYRKTVSILGCLAVTFLISACSMSGVSQKEEGKDNYLSAGGTEEEEDISAANEDSISDDSSVSDDEKTIAAEENTALETEETTVSDDTSVYETEETGESEDITTSDTEASEDIAVSEDCSEVLESSEEGGGLLKSTEDINLRDVDGSGTNYMFTYNGENFSAVYTTDNWRITDSYKIENVDDMLIICEALISIHPVHGSDMQSYRTAQDMAYEWLQHDLAYELLSDDDPLKANAKDVDLDPKDQNRSFEEIYKDRTGKEFSLSDFLN